VLAFGCLRFSLDLLGGSFESPRNAKDCSGHRYSPTRRMRDDQSTKFRRSARRLFPLAFRKEADGSRLSGGGGRGCAKPSAWQLCDAAPGRNAAALLGIKLGPVNRRLH
jgi:hypothetical protein